MSDLPATLAEALVALQADLPRIERKTEGQSGPRRYKYADLPDITAILLPRLAELGLVWTTAPTLMELGGEVKFVLDYELRHAASGEKREGWYPLGTGNPQQLGSAITYARRYCLCAVTGIAPDDDDDDGQAATDEARALQRRPPETDAHGAATFAEQTRMVTGPVPGVTRHTATAGEPSEWDGTADATAEKVHRNRSAQMFALYRDLGLEGDRDKDAMLADLSDMLKRPITSRKDLNLSELTTVCAILRRRVEARVPAEATP